MDRDAIKKKILENAYGNAAPLNAGTITLGCEFEFVLMYHRPSETEPQHGPKHGVNLIRDALCQPQNVKCADSNCNEQFEFTLSVISSDGDQYDKWQVGIDQSVIANYSELRSLYSKEKLKNLVFEPVEVKSRILRYDEAGERADGEHEHWITFQDEITLVLSLLNKNFGFGHEDNAGSKYHVLATAQSGLHVHIANGKSLSVPFRTAKKVYSIFVACERQLDGLVGTRDIMGIKLATQAPKRPISGATDLYEHSLNSAYNKPVSAYLIAGTHMRRQWEHGSPDKPLTQSLRGDKAILDQLYPQTRSKTMKDFDDVKFGMNIDSWLTLVNGAEDSVDLCGLNCIMDRQCTLNMRHLPSALPLPTMMKKPLAQDPVLEKLLTIEFRQHAGTLVALEALSFIDVVVKLVLFCDKTKDEEFQMLIKPGGKLREPHFHSLDLLKFFGCTAETYKFYESQILWNNSPLTKQLNLEEEILSKYRDQIPVADYALSEIEKRRKSMSPAEVQKLITQKLLTGGYGQYSHEDLDVLLPNGTSAEQREKLAIGYRVPLNFNDDDDDDDGWLPKLLAGLARTD